jgi:hypothetical protein
MVVVIFFNTYGHLFSTREYFYEHFMFTRETCDYRKINGPWNHTCIQLVKINEQNNMCNQGLTHEKDEYRDISRNCLFITCDEYILLMQVNSPNVPFWEIFQQGKVCTKMMLQRMARRSHPRNMVDITFQCLRPYNYLTDMLVPFCIPGSKRQPLYKDEIPIC